LNTIIAKNTDEIKASSKIIKTGIDRNAIINA